MLHNFLTKCVQLTKFTTVINRREIYHHESVRVYIKVYDSRVLLLSSIPILFPKLDFKVKVLSDKIEVRFYRTVIQRFENVLSALKNKQKLMLKLIYFSVKYLLRKEIQLIIEEKFLYKICT